MKIYWSGGSKNIIGPRVRSLRRERGLTQKALARCLGVPYAALLDEEGEGDTSPAK